MYRAVGPSLATTLEPLVYCPNVASSSLFYRCYFLRCSSELAQLVQVKSLFCVDLGVRRIIKTNNLHQIILHRKKSCVKSVQIRSFFLSVLSSLFPNSGKYGPDKNSVFGHISHCEREVYHYKKAHAFVNWEQVFANSSIE